MSKRNENDMYNVLTYTDQELYDILDLSNPTDRELEAKIIFLYRKYKNMQNDSGEQLAKFFNDIHNHFFENEEEEEDIVIEGMTTLTDIKKKEDIIKPKLDISTDSRMLTYDKAVPDNELTGNVYYSTDNGNTFVVGNTIPTKLSNSIPPTIQTEQVNFVKQLDYASDNMNPLLQQTITRVISIDSQYRSDKSSLSTDFTFDLSDPLKDVVSLSLYSVQIPYTWYTIAKSYGSNFFYIKGNSPGINNGNHNIQIEIAPGNYSPSDLVTAVNNSIKSNYSVYTDISFGSTSISYNSNTSLSTIQVGITKQYSENSYDLSFNYWTTPNLYDSNGKLDDVTRSLETYSSIPCFLGLNQKIYSLNTINTVIFTSTDLLNNDKFTYKIDPLSTTIKIIKYVSTINNNQADFYDPITSYVDLSFSLTLSLLTDGTKYSRNDIIADLSNQLLKSVYLSNESTISLVNVTQVGDIRYGNSYYQLKVKPNRYTTNNSTNSKFFLQLPDESNINPANTAIWTGISSCFRFTDLSNELQLITAETPVVKQTNEYTIKVSNNAPPYVSLKCVNTYFTLKTQNDISFSFQKNQTTNLYSVSQLIDSINLGIIDVSTSYPFLNGLPNLNYTYDPATNSKPPNYSLAYVDQNYTFSLALDIEKDFINRNYVIDFLDTSFNKLFKLGDVNNEPITNSPLSGIASIANTFDKITIKNGSVLFRIKPNSVISDICGNEQDFIGPIIYNDPINTSTVFNNYSSVVSTITSYLLNYTYQGSQLFYPGTQFNITLNSVANNISVSLDLNILRKITAKDYSIQFIDINNSNYTNATGNVNFWKDPFNMNNTSFITTPYYLSNNNSVIIKPDGSTSITVKGDNPIQTYTIDFENMPVGSNIFNFNAYEDGVFAKEGTNNISVTIPIYDSNSISIKYTRDMLISAINKLLSADVRSNGTYLYLTSKDQTNYYVNIRPNINKIYTAKDYKVVFYDAISYVKCFIGATGVQNTTWDSTLGWILGYRNSSYYNLNQPDGTYILPPDSNNIITIISDTAVSTNLYNYFLICLDDYNLNHLNDGLVTITGQDTSVPLPSYADRSNFQCDPITGQLTYNANAASSTDQNSQLTQNQLYSLTQKANAKNATTSNISGGQTTASYGRGPFSEDVFAMIPMKVAGLANGSYFVEYGGTLQNNNRYYFGPVNIHRMSVKLISDKGNTVDLNGTNWSFSFLCQQLYKQKNKPKK